MNELMIKIINRLKPVLERFGAYLIDFNYSKVKKAYKYTFYIDKDDYITIDDLSIISREIEKILIDENFITYDDQIEVSSPGVDRPLKFLRQYPKHKEKYFSVSFRVDDKVITKELILKDVVNDKLFFDDKGKILEINYSDIIKAKTLIKFR